MDRQRFNENVAAARDQRNGDRAAEMQQRLAQTERQLDELRAARDVALARANAATEGAPSALTAANAELQRTLQEANQLKGLFDTESLGDQLAGAEEGTAGLMAQSSPAATGTFSAAAAMAMFGAGRDDAAKETAENTRAMRRRMEQAARQGNVYPVFVG